MDTRDPELKKDLDALLGTRKELGAEYESELVESFLQRLDESVERRVRRQVAQSQMTVARGETTPRDPAAAPPPGFGGRVGLAISSLVLAVPLSAIAAVNEGLPGLLISWAGVVGVNVAAASSTWFGGRAKRERPSEWD